MGREGMGLNTQTSQTITELQTPSCFCDWYMFVYVCECVSVFEYPNRRQEEPTECLGAFIRYTNEVCLWGVGWALMVVSTCQACFFFVWLL